MIHLPYTLAGLADICADQSARYSMSGVHVTDRGHVYGMATTSPLALPPKRRQDLCSMPCKCRSLDRVVRSGCPRCPGGDFLLEVGSCQE
jgi:hypothetical protein